MKSKWFIEWISGKRGYGPNVTYYQNDDKNVSFSGYKRLDCPNKKDSIWKDLGFGETIETINGSLWERIK